MISGGKWTVRVGGGFGKVVRLGEQPIKLDLDAYYNAIRPKGSRRDLAVAGHRHLSISRLAVEEKR